MKNIIRRENSQWDSENLVMFQSLSRQNFFVTMLTAIINDVTSVDVGILT